ncbi:hypothetical protein [Streptomyces fulvoviolaceus]|uniref:hypothetical protein n=1 Tax=Streptomyces fulvoviolaceus TaxID=285535 RepID=UPI0004C6FA14|nr:hypothetical protein [Streptomyces fulvoviolaceus]MCT9077931.1 hypothetical protein [Streptomyces fulvoviolaceus]
MSLPDVEYAVLSHSVSASLPVSISDVTKRIGQVMLRTATLEEFHKRSEETLSWFGERITVVPSGLGVGELRAMQPALGSDKALLADYRRDDR